jgi:two-component system chemotaxis sensor kinase CheA
LLDKLMTLVGELVLARNQILQFNAAQKDAAFLNSTQRLNLITSELQESVMKTRMQPIGTIWDRLPRMVRDLALTCGKKVRVDMEGKDTELDKTIIEAIKDPLTHVVRNSVDHGIEPPETRLERGKQAEGCLSLRAFHEGGQVLIEITDDGGGINPEKVKNKAVERGLINAEQAGRLSDREMIGLIFLPGFSTAETITNVSGRGVGMDVVKTNIEKINGSVDLQSKLGLGTTLRIKIPLTLAIIPALTVVSGGERYAIPQVSLVELVRLDRDEPGRGIEDVHGAPVYRLRGQLLPLVFLEDILQSKCPGAEREALNLVVLQAEHRQFGLVVDRIHDTEEIVVKPLSQQLKSIRLYAGATVMGDGRVALILDVLGIAQLAGLIAERERKIVEDTAQPDALGDQHACLLVQAGSSRRLAIPLAMVARLEEIVPRDIERADEQQVLQYRGQILPLIHVGTMLFGEMPDPTQESLPLVVCSENNRSVGLLVERIVDIVKTPLDQRCRTHRTGLLGSAVINSQVTDLMDVGGFLETLSV